MATQPPNKPTPPSDEDLLANAIPIENIEEEESAPIELEPEPVAASKPAADDTPAPIELDESGETSHREIKAFGRREAANLEAKWRRKVNTTRTGAVHVRTFVAKLRMDAIEHLDEQINSWLDEHPEYEVKFVTATIGILTGKLREEALFVNVWV